MFPHMHAGFNSILIDRGDRVSIQGDGHPTMAAALVAFSPFELVADMINATDSGSVHGHSVVTSPHLSVCVYDLLIVHFLFCRWIPVSWRIQCIGPCRSMIGSSNIFLELIA